MQRLGTVGTLPTIVDHTAYRVVQEALTNAVRHADATEVRVLLRRQGFKFDIMATSFFLSRRSIRPAAHSGMPLWQDRIFITLAKNANDATDFFQIPTGRVVEVGTQVTV